MGKGDKKSRRGKIVMGSHGVRRPRKKAARTRPALLEKEEKPVVATKEKAPARKKTSAKASAKKEEKAEE